jgi:glycosyltransferase involved in cell wall biosynthesis
MSFSVIIPAFNEERLLRKTLRAVIGGGETIVVDNESTDKTVQIAMSFGAKVDAEARTK